MARRLIGLDIGTNAVTVAEVRAGDPPRLEMFGQVALGRETMREGEVADAMRVSTMTVYRLIRSESLGAIRVGKHFRVRTRDLEGYLEAQSTRGGDAWPAA